MYLLTMAFSLKWWFLNKNKQFEVILQKIHEYWTEKYHAFAAAYCAAH